MKKIFFAFFALFGFLASAIAGTITGQIQTPSTGRGVPNGALTFTLSQPAVVSGTATLAGNGNCWTDNAGNIVGLPGDAAIAAPVLSSNLGSGALAGGNYFVRYTWANATGETQPSAERSLFLSSTGTLIVQAPVNVPALATSMKIYIGVTAGGESLQGSVAVTNGVIAGNYSQSVPLVNGAVPPSANTTACQIRFNDELQPSFTAYSVTFTNLNGAGIAGFPQKWYLSGGSNGTINVSNGTPLYAGVVQYPQAIVSNPAANGTQSINGALNLNGFGLTGAILNNSGSSNTVARICSYGTGNQMNGSGSFQTIYSCAIPANVIQGNSNGGIRFRFGVYHQVGNATVSWKVVLGSTTLVSWSDSTPSLTAGSFINGQCVTTSGQNNEWCQLDPIFGGSTGTTILVGTTQAAGLNENFVSPLTLSVQFSVSNSDKVNTSGGWVEVLQ